MCQGLAGVVSKRTTKAHLAFLGTTLRDLCCVAAHTASVAAVAAFSPGLCSLSAVTIHGRGTLMSSSDLNAAREVAWELVPQLSEAHGNEVLSLLHGQHLAHQQLLMQQQEEEAQGQLQLQGPQGQAAGDMQQQQPDAGGADDIDGDDDDAVTWGGPLSEADGSISGSGSLNPADNEQDSSDNEADDDVSTDEPDGGGFDDVGIMQQQGGVSSSKPSVGARLEPGVMALAVKGGAIVCVDTLGNVLVRDFATGTPTPQQLQQHISGRSRAGSADAAGGGGGGGGSCGGGIAGGGGGSSSGGGGGGGGSGQPPLTTGGLDAHDSALLSKFWRV